MYILVTGLALAGVAAHGFNYAQSQVNSVSPEHSGAAVPVPPTPTPTPEPTETTVPPTVVPATITLTPTSTPTITPRPCDSTVISLSHLHEAWASALVDGQFAMFNRGAGTSQDFLSSFYQRSCVRQLFQSCMIPDGHQPRFIGYSVFHDECVFLRLANRANEMRGRGSAYCGWFNNQQWSCMQSNVPYNPFHRCRHMGGDPVRGHCANTPMVVYMDENCNLVQQPGTVCGVLNASSVYTPISLIWDTGADIEKIKSVVSFEMRPNEGKKSHTWRGSEKTPLLVWDPEMRGRIINGTQLFGEYTWGGKATSSIDQEALEGANPKWEHGFDALKYLDHDSDGKVSDDELASLALWFDKNQNAISEPGEVIPVREAGIRSLFYKVDERDERAKLIKVTVGYEREVDGKISSGSSVDWYGETSDSKFDLYSIDAARSAMESGSSTTAETESARSTLVTPLTPETQSSIAGVWLWALEEDIASSGAAPAGGFFFLTVDGERGEVRGSSLVETPLEKWDGKKLRMLTQAKIVGDVDIKTPSHFTFKVYQGGKLIATSSARVTEGGTLEGETKPVGGTLGAYKWKARRS